MTIALIDYGIGNLRSVKKALEAVGAKVLLTDDSEIILNASKVILPGVGAFQDGMSGLENRDLITTLNEIFKQQIPLLGICLGMQLFFDTSSEMGSCEGLGFIQGEVRKFSNINLKIPHTGWNQLQIIRESPLLFGIDDNPYVYFNHSYYCKTFQAIEVIAHTEYGLRYTSVLQKGSLYGVQFHPEKSHDVGLKMIRNFVEVCK